MCQVIQDLGFNGVAEGQQWVEGVRVWAFEANIGEPRHQWKSGTSWKCGLVIIEAHCQVTAMWSNAIQGGHRLDRTFL